MIKIPSQTSQKRVKINIDTQKGGTNTLIDSPRLNLEQASETSNMIQVQDGLWASRWGSGYFGNALSAESALDGASEYIATSGDRELIVVGGTTGKVYKSTNDGSSWTEISGATMTTGNQCFFIQINDQLWITNGVNNLTIYNGTSLSRNTALTKPANLSATRGAGLSAGSYTYYYTVVALNDVGFTEGSVEASVTVNKLRDNWNSASNENVALAWDAVVGANRYEVYISDESGNQIYLADSTTNAYTDDASAEPNIYREVPDANTTGGPILEQMALSGNRVWGIDKNTGYVVFSGTGQDITRFSFFYGGGYIGLESGGRDTAEAVTHFRTGKGDSIATVLASSPEGKGSIWQIAFDTITIGSTTVIIPTPVKVVGSIGTNSALGLVNGGENVMFPNKKGIYALRNKTQLFNVLATEEQSVNIRPSYLSIAEDMISSIAGYFYEGKAFFSASVGGSNNDTTFIYDTERNNWNWKWDIGFKQFFEYTDTANSTHFLAIVPSTNRLVEISSKFSRDYNGGFNTSWTSPIIHADQNDHTQFAKFQEAFVELGRPVGTVRFEVLGVEKNKSFSQVASRNITDSVSSIDFCNSLFGDYEWGSDDATPTTFSQATVKKRIKLNKLLNTIQFRISSTQAGTQYTILGVQAKGSVVPTRAPSSWNN